MPPRRRGLEQFVHGVKTSARNIHNRVEGLVGHDATQCPGTAVYTKPDVALQQLQHWLKGVQCTEIGKLSLQFHDVAAGFRG